MNPSEYFRDMRDGWIEYDNEHRKDIEDKIIALLEAIEVCPIGVLRNLPNSGFSDTSKNTFTGEILHLSLALREDK